MDPFGSYIGGQPAHTEPPDPCVDDALLITPPVDGVAILTLNRPARRNALSTDLLSRLAASLAAASEDSACRVVVLSGGPTLFAAGADVSEIEQASAADPVDGPRFRAWQAIRAFSKPLVAAVEGWCLGAGLELAMTADMIVAGATAKLGQPETNLGIMPGGGGTALLSRLVGRALATRMILTGEPIDAHRALQAGLVGEVVPTGSALEVAMRLARMLAVRAPLALAAAKASIRAADELPLSMQISEERRRFVDLLGSEDKAEGIAAFRERRPPRWVGG